MVLREIDNPCMYLNIVRPTNTVFVTGRESLVAHRKEENPAVLPPLDAVLGVWKLKSATLNEHFRTLAIPSSYIGFYNHGEQGVLEAVLPRHT